MYKFSCFLLDVYIMTIRKLNKRNMNIKFVLWCRYIHDQQKFTFACVSNVIQIIIDTDHTNSNANIYRNFKTPVKNIP